MGILAALERRAHPGSGDPVLVEMFGGRRVAAGVRVTEERALGIVAVYAAVRIIAETIATLPLHVYRRLTPRGKERDAAHPLYPILHDQPNDWQTSVEFWEMIVGHTVLRGNGYAYIVPARRQAIGGLIPLHPSRMQVRRGPPGRLWYEYAPPSGGAPEVFLQDEVFHLRGLSSDGLVGLGPVQLAREALGVTIAAEEHGARFFANAATPSGVLEIPGNLSDDARKKLRTSWQEGYTGENKHRVALLEDGLKWHQVGMTARDAEFVATRKFQLSEIARMFRVPPHMLADLDKATFSNIEQQSIEFVVHTIRPWVVRIERAIARDLMTEESRRTHFPAFLLDGLLRGDLKSRYDAYAVGRTNGWLSANDIRELEDQNPLPGEQGEIYLVPLNMIPANDIGGNDDADGAAAPTDPDRPDESNAGSRALRRLVDRLATAQRRVMADAIARALRKEVSAARRALDQAKSARSTVPMEQWIDEFYADHAAFVARTVRPAVHASVEAFEAAARAGVGGPGIAEPALDTIASDAATDIAARHVASSCGPLRALLRDAPAVEVAAQIAARLDEWEASRPTDVAVQELTRLRDATITAVRQAAGLAREEAS